MVPQRVYSSFPQACQASLVVAVGCSGGAQACFEDCGLWEGCCSHHCNGMQQAADFAPPESCRVPDVMWLASLNDTMPAAGSAGRQSHLAPAALGACADQQHAGGGPQFPAWTSPANFSRRALCACRRLTAYATCTGRSSTLQAWTETAVPSPTRARGVGCPRCRRAGGQPRRCLLSTGHR